MLTECINLERNMVHSKAVVGLYSPRVLPEGCMTAAQVAAAVFFFRGTVLTKRSKVEHDMGHSNAVLYVCGQQSCLKASFQLCRRLRRSGTMLTECSKSGNEAI